MKWVKKLEKILIFDEEIELEFLEHFYFELYKFDIVDTSSDFEGLVVIIDLVMELRGQKDANE